MTRKVILVQRRAVRYLSFMSSAVTLETHTWYGLHCHYVLKNGTIRTCNIRHIVVNMGDCYVELVVSGGNVLMVSPAYVMAINCFYCNIDIMSESDEDSRIEVKSLPKLRLTDKTLFKQLPLVHQTILKRLLCETNRIKKAISLNNTIQAVDIHVQSNIVV